MRPPLTCTVHETHPEVMQRPALRQDRQCLLHVAHRRPSKVLIIAHKERCELGPPVQSQSQSWALILSRDYRRSASFLSLRAWTHGPLVQRPTKECSRLLLSSRTLCQFYLKRTCMAAFGRPALAIKDVSVRTTDCVQGKVFKLLFRIFPGALFSIWDLPPHLLAAAEMDPQRPGDAQQAQAREQQRPGVAQRCWLRVHGELVRRLRCT